MVESKFQGKLMRYKHDIQFRISVHFLLRFKKNLS